MLKRRTIHLSCMVLLFSVVSSVHFAYIEPLYVAKDTSAGEGEAKRVAKTKDIDNIVVKEHHWIENAYGVSWSPNGDYLVFCRANDGFYITGPLCQNIRSLGKGMHFLGVSTDGKTVYGSYSKGSMSEGIFGIDVANGSTKKIADVLYSDIYWSPSGEQAMVLTATGEWVMINADGTPQKSLKGAIWQSWSPDGTKFIARAMDGNQYVFSIDGKIINTILSRDRVGWAGNTGKLWVRYTRTLDIIEMNPDGTEHRVVAKSILSPIFSPSGQWIIYEDMETGRKIALHLTDSKKIILDSIKTDFIIWLRGEDRIITRYGQKYSQFSIVSLDTAKEKADVLYSATGAPFLSSDSQYLAFCSIPLELNVSDVDGSVVKTLTKVGTEYPGEGYSIAWSPKEDAIAYSDPIRELVGVITLDKKQSSVTKIQKEAVSDFDPETTDVNDIVVRDCQWLENAYGLRWSQDCSYAVFKSSHGFCVTDPSGRAIHPYGKDMELMWMSPDGRTLYGSNRGLRINKQTMNEGLLAINIMNGSTTEITKAKFVNSFFSPMGDYVALYLDSNRVKIFGLENTTDVNDIAIDEFQWNSGCYGLRWSPNGKYIAFCKRGDGFYITDLSSQSTRPIGKGMALEEISSDGSVLYASRAKQIQLENGSLSWSRPFEGLFAVNINDGSIREISNAKFEKSYWSQNKDYAILKLESNQGSILSIKDGSHKEISITNFSDVHWSPNGEYAVLTLPGNPTLWNIVSVKDSNPKSLDPPALTHPNFSPSDSWVAYFETAENAVMLRLSDRKKVNIGPKDTRRIIWLPGEERILVPDQGRKQWYMVSLNENQSSGKRVDIPLDKDYISPNSRLAAFVSDAGSLELWIRDIDKQKNKMLIETEGRQILSHEQLRRIYRPLLWSPDGKVIVYSGGGCITMVTLGCKGP